MGWNAPFLLDRPFAEGTVYALYTLPTEKRSKWNENVSWHYPLAWASHFFSFLSAFPFMSLSPVNSLGCSVQWKTKKRDHSYFELNSQLNLLHPAAIISNKNPGYGEITVPGVCSQASPGLARKLPRWPKIQRFCNQLMQGWGIGFWWCDASLC